MKPLVSIIIVNWNGRESLKDCLNSLKKLKTNNWKLEIIVVDNGSIDGSVEFIKELTSSRVKELKNPLIDNKIIIRLIENKENLGFAEANNIGFKEAKGEYILFLNNDTKVTPDFLTKLVDAIEGDRKIGVVQPKIILMDGGKLQAGGAFLTNSGFLYHFGFGKDPDGKKYNQQMDIFSANGSCMLVKREVVERVGLFDPDFFCYFEETDFCWRVWLNGYKVTYIPSAVIYHKGSQAAQRLKPGKVAFYSFKNRICSLIKNLSFGELFKMMPIHLVFCQLVCLAYLITGGFASVFAIQKAIGWNIFNLGKTLQKRNIIQDKLRKLKDRELFPLVMRQVHLLYYYYLFKGLVGKYEE